MKSPWKTKGIVLTAPLSEEIDDVIKLIDEYLAPRGFNMIVMQVRYRYQFKRHPEVWGYDPLSLEDVKKLLDAKAAPIDLIRVNDTYSINVVNCGFDTYVASTMAKVKRKKLIGGKNAYTTGVVAALFKAMVNRASIEVDGERFNDGKFLLFSVANGQFYGGSFRCAPLSLNDDGLLEICMVKCISIFTFLRLIKDYTYGRHLDKPKFSKIVKYTRAKRVVLEGDDKFCVTVDGELLKSSRVELEVVPSAIKFAAPEPFIISAQKNALESESAAIKI